MPLTLDGILGSWFSLDQLQHLWLLGGMNPVDRKSSSSEIINNNSKNECIPLCICSVLTEHLLCVRNQETESPTLMELSLPGFPYTEYQSHSISCACSSS